MLMKQLLLSLLLFSFLSACSESDAIHEPQTSLYFPPLTGNTWETTSAEALN